MSEISQDDINIFSASARVSLMIALQRFEKITFTELVARTRLTEGNAFAHLRVLRVARYVTVESFIVNGKNSNVWLAT